MSKKADNVKAQLDRYITAMGERPITALRVTPEQYKTLEKHYGEGWTSRYRGFLVEMYRY
jgi:hypothetical protein